jgi:hypothetical protein
MCIISEQNDVAFIKKKKKRPEILHICTQNEIKSDNNNFCIIQVFEM